MDLELDFDPQTVCRICLAPSDRLLNLFASTVVDGYLTAVPDMIHACLDLRVNPTDMMPGKLCNGCKTDITNFYVFRQKSQRTDRLLRSMLPTPVDLMKAEPASISTIPMTLQPAPTSQNHAALSVLLPTQQPPSQSLPVRDPVAPIIQMIGCEFCDQSFPGECELSNHCMDKHATVDDELPPSKGRFAVDLLDLPETTDLLSILTAEQPLDDVHVDDEDDDSDAQNSQTADHDHESTTTIELLMPTIVKHEHDGQEDDDEDVEDLEEEHLDIADFEDTGDDASEAVHTAELNYQCDQCPRCVGSADELDEHLKIDHSLFRCALCSQTMRQRTLRQHQQTCTGAATVAVGSSAVALPSTTTTSDPEDELNDTDSVLMTLKSEADDGDDDDDDEYTLADDDDNTENTDDSSYETPVRKRRKTVSSTTPSHSAAAAPPAARKARTAPFIEACQVCERWFSNQKRFELHQRMHQHMDVINAYVVFHPCHLCRSIYLKAGDLRRHQRQQHDMDVGNEDEDADDDDADGEMASLVLKLDASVTATPAIGDDEDTDYTDYQFLEDDGYESGEYKCGVCDSAYASSQETKYHLLVNHVQGFMCPMPACGFQYDQFVRFSLHMANKHINAAAQRCGHCGAEHRTFDELQAHIRNDCVERKFACAGHCDKKFFSRKAMNNHLAWSRGKRYICASCDKAFAQPGELSIHMRMHTQERPFACTVCGKAYKTSSMRASHMDTHIEGKTFTCTICGKSLQTRTCYRNHLKRHTAVKKHECGYCQKRFHTRYHINQHISKVHEKGAGVAAASTTATTMRSDHLDDDDDEDDPLGMDLME